MLAQNTGGRNHAWLKIGRFPQDFCDLRKKHRAPVRRMRYDDNGLAGRGNSLPTQKGENYEQSR
jgi:hypothetical protein